MLFCNDAGDDDDIKWRSGLRWHDDTPTETAPIKGGDNGPQPTPYDNPNLD
jgi:hypothetical protein